MVNNQEWISTVSYTPLLRHTVLAPLLSEYVPDGVGISPTTVQHAAITMATQQKSAPTATDATQTKSKFISSCDG